MTRDKPACVLAVNLLGSFSPALCIEHTDDTSPVQLPSWCPNIPEGQGQVDIPVFTYLPYSILLPSLTQPICCLLSCSDLRKNFCLEFTLLSGPE